MTLEETRKILAVMVMTYPNYKPDDLDGTATVWHMMLSDYDYRDISMALKLYVTQDKSGFAPAIGQLIDRIQSTKELPMSEQETWAYVSKAIRNSIYNSEKEYAKLPLVVQKAVGTPSNLRKWAMIEGDSAVSVTQSQFLRSYRQVAQRMSDDAKLPQRMRESIEANRKLPERFQVQEVYEQIEQKAEVIRLEDPTAKMDEFRRRVGG